MSRPDIPITISGDERAFLGSLARVRAATKTTASDLVGSFLRVKGAIGNVGTIAAALGVGSIISAAKSVNDLGRAARTAGVDFETFQELKYAAEQNLIGVDALTDGIKELQLRADEFVKSGAGPAAESFARLGMTADDVAKALDDPAQMFDAIIDRIKQLDRAAQIRVLDELFGGTAAEQFTQFLDQSARSISSLRDEAKAFGVVMDEEFLQTAQDAERRFNALSAVVGTRLKSAIVEAAEALFSFIDSFRDFEKQQDDTLSTRQAELGLQKLDLENQILQNKNDPWLNSRARNVANGGLTRQLGELTAEDARITEIFRSRMKTEERSKLEAKPWVPPDIPNASPSDTRSRSSSAASAKEEKSAYDNVAASLREELALIGKSATEREKMMALRQAGVTAASAEGQEILKLIDLKTQEQQAEDAVTDARERAIEAAESLGQTLDEQLLRIIDGTFDARDALAMLVQELINAGTQGKGLFRSLFSALADSGGLDSLLGDSSQPAFTPNTTLSAVLGYGGARAGGGDVSPGRIYRINEWEDEFFAPSKHGRVYAPSKLPNDPMQNGSSGNITIRLDLSADVEARIMENSSNATVSIVRQNNQDMANYRQNGGNF